MKIGPHLAYIVVQPPYRPDEHQKLSKAAGIGGNSMRQTIDVVMFLDREGAEEFQQSDIVFREHAEVVEVVVADSDTHYNLTDSLAIAERRIKTLTYDLDIARNPAWMPADLPPGPLPDNYGRSRNVLVVTRGGRILVAHAYWTSRPGDGAQLPQWYDDLNPIDYVTGWTSLPRHPSERGLKRRTTDYRS